MRIYCKFQNQQNNKHVYKLAVDCCGLVSRETIL